MRPIASEQNPLRYPLNEILGTRAQVRLLRVMASEIEGPLTASDVAQRAGLTVPGAHKALANLQKSGFVSRVGGGRGRQYEIRRSDPLMQLIIELFQTEKSRYEDLLTAIKRKIENLSPPPQAAWVQSLPREMNDPLVLGLLHTPFNIAECVRQLRAALSQVETDLDLTIELAGYTKADLPDLEIENIIPLYGVLPAPLNSLARPRTEKTRTHADQDERLEVLSQQLAGLLERDPSLVRRAKDYLNRLLQEDQGTATGDLREWKDIIDTYSIQRLARFFTSSSARASHLRQSNPFWAVLTPSERAQLLDQRGEQK